MSNAFDWLNAGGGSGDPVADVEAKNDEVLREARRLQREEAMIFFRALGSRDGMNLLMHLRSKTIELPMLDLNGTIEGERRNVPLNPSEWLFVREGQNSVIRHIEEMMRVATASEQEEETPNA